jgi:carboxypeptidase C (cathepsin A)
MNVYDVRLTDEYPACGMNWPPELSDVYTYLRVRPSLAAILVFRLLADLSPLSRFSDQT